MELKWMKVSLWVKIRRFIYVTRILTQFQSRAKYWIFHVRKSDMKPF